MSFVTVLLSAAGSIGPIIPPSILMVLIGYSTGASVGQLFLGGAIPGVMIGVALMVYSIFTLPGAEMHISRQPSLIRKKYGERCFLHFLV